jgi:hypothetical protein
MQQRFINGTTSVKLYQEILFPAAGGTSSQEKISYDKIGRRVNTNHLAVRP